ncbi:S8 family serine peptidase [Bacteriovorax sp. Seq25_V]|uniref:S8 family serine peptidase n=1 Tax=Bacteriovorax sp. Seq25_V TaxID=1201288 RepID=UPI00038A056E|nr:S8 family serine peptidase [Bacteriovorax sp. Seq25_V]EQC44324.1 peptidase, S8/S53 family [Bacteriovorax sp. Seq25_V]
MSPKNGLFLLTFIISQYSFATTCPSVKERTEGVWKTVSYCEKDILTKELEYYIPTGSKTKEIHFNSKGQEVSVDSWSTDGIHRYSSVIEHKDESHYTETSYSTDGKRSLVSKEEHTLLEGDDFITKEWVITKSSHIPQAIKHYKIAAEKPYRIDVLNKEGEVVKYYLVTFNMDAPLANLVNEFQAYTPEGALIGSYDESSDFDIVSHIKRTSKTEAEATEKIRIFENKYREPVVIIDTGFDIMHPTITHKLYNSPVEISGDGIDNDGNGRIDDSWGWQRQDDAGLSLLRDDNNIRETHSLIHTPYPVSHGTHVASLALRDLDSYGLVGFAGDVAIADHLEKAGDYIADKNIRFVNMSFAIGFPGVPMSAPRESFYYLENIFIQNPNALFTVAAGNGRGELDLDQKGNDNFPASYNYNNMIKVGAINTSELSINDYPNYKMASFSKYGISKVQIFAPGQGVVSAQSGGGDIALNGTSMASPYVMNVLLKGHELNKKLDTQSLKELLLKTVYIPKGNPFPCQSGGIVVPERFYHAIKNVSNDGSLISAIESARKTIAIAGEERSLEVISKMWRERGL